jgi:glucose/arabinose dehydrogenase
VTRLTLTIAAAALLATAASAPGTTTATYTFRPVLKAAFVTHVASPSRNRLYIVQQNGRIRLAVGGKLRPTPFLDLRSRVIFGREQGMLSMAFHPAFARNRLFYVAYVGVGNITRVVEYRANKDGTAALPRTARILLSVRQPGDEHKGGQLAFGPDGRLYVGFGDGECCDDPANRAQNPALPYGKLFRLDARASRPQREMVALGLRNPWRFSFDRATGDLYIADVGAGLWEEIDFVPRAELGQLLNFGWDVYEARAIKEQKPPSPQGRLTFPVHAYGHDVGCSISGGFVYRGSRVPAARGRYFFGDYCSGTIWSLRMVNGNATDVRVEDFRIRGLSTFGEDSSGELYAASASTGRVFRLAP